LLFLVFRLDGRPLVWACSDTAVMHSCKALDILEMPLQCLSFTEAYCHTVQSNQGNNFFACVPRTSGTADSVTSCSNHTANKSIESNHNVQTR